MAVISMTMLTANGFATEDKHYVFEAGHASLQEWRLPETMPAPADNPTTAAKVALGKKLFFDPRISGDGNISCASCHNPSLGWSDGLPKARGVKGVELDRASPSIVNAGFNALQMWDGRKKTLEDQAMAPMLSPREMNVDKDRLFQWLAGNDEYRQAFESVFPGEAIDETTVSKAIAAFERTVISRDSAFDRWIQGDGDAMTRQQIKGFELFVGKAKCDVCHSPPNFVDDGFHNVGLASFGDDAPDLGRYRERPLGLLKGAFKTPALRDVARTAPYFHDGSATTLAAVIEHYVNGGEVKTNLSPNMEKVDLDAAEQAALVAFLHALTTPYKAVALPELSMQAPTTGKRPPLSGAVSNEDATLVVLEEGER